MLIIVNIDLTPFFYFLADKIVWNGDWGKNCDFGGADFKNDRSNPENCGPLCETTPGCTHYTWNGYNGGTCWMKNGDVTKEQAVYIKYSICGIVNCKIIFYPLFSNRGFIQGYDVHES